MVLPEGTTTEAQAYLPLGYVPSFVPDSQQNVNPTGPARPCFLSTSQNPQVQKMDNQYQFNVALLLLLYCLGF
jgi:hypothetical protein